MGVGCEQLAPPSLCRALATGGRGGAYEGALLASVEVVSLLRHLTILGLRRRLARAQGCEDSACRVAGVGPARQTDSDGPVIAVLGLCRWF